MLEFLASTVLMIIFAPLFWLTDKIIVQPVIWLLVVGHRPHWELFTWGTRSITSSAFKLFPGLEKLPNRDRESFADVRYKQFQGLQKRPVDGGVRKIVLHR